jgi:sarcosine oxidase subunit gamma
MSDLNAQAIALTLHPALDGKTVIARNGVLLEPVFGGHVLQLLAQGTPALPNATLRTVSPGQWFIVGDNALSHNELTALAASLKPAAIVDQTGGRVRLRVSGPRAARVLAKGTAIDFASAAFPVGASAMTLIGHIGAHITRIGDDAFEIMALRGFAESLWDELDHMSREFI